MTKDKAGAARSEIKSNVIRVCMNNYALEALIMGDINPHEKISYDKFIQIMDLCGYDTADFPKNELCGAVIDENETLREKDIDYCKKAFYEFHYKMTYFNEIVEEIYSKESSFRQYLDELFTVFSEIMEIPLSKDETNAMKDERVEAVDYSFNKFLTAIRKRNLKKGSRVTRYLKNIKQYPIHIKRIVEQKDGAFTLTEDFDSAAYKAAVLGALYFYNSRHKMMFELKTAKWLRLSHV